jgi:uncharacterized protein YjbI with pentapeptide repeats
MIQIKHKYNGTALFEVKADNLRVANLSDADLRVANLSDADLSDADLMRADLSDADLSDANLRGADLMRAYLMRANLRGADLSDANLRGANLMRADLSDADLSDADLRGADLRGANLSDAHLRGANLEGAKGLSQFVVAGQGALVGYKKTTTGIVTLSIPVSAGRVNAYGSRKCRAEYAVVIDAPDGSRSLHDSDFTYTIGQTVRPDSFDPDPRVECSHGIHFFITREEAEEY